MKISKEQAEQLYAKGHISEKSLAALGGHVQRFADGGEVQNMSVPSDQQVADLTRQPTGLEYLQGVASSQNASPAAATAAPSREDELRADMDERMGQLVGKIGSTAKDFLFGSAPQTPSQKLYAAEKAAGENVGSQNVQQAASAEGPQVSQPAAPGTLSSDKSQAPNPMAVMGQMYGNMGKSYDQAFGMEAKGAQIARDAGVKLANAQAGYLEKMAQEGEKYAQVQQAKEAERQGALADAQKQVDSLSERYNGPEAKLNPNRVFQNMSTGQKIMSFIGFVLAGKAAPEMYNNIINRDLEAQKNNVANIGRQLAVKENLLGQMRARFGDERQAETAARMVMLDNFKIRLEQEAAKYKAPEVQANYMQAMGHIMKERAGLQAQFAQMTMARLPMMMAGDQMRDILYKVPEKMQDTAVKELGEYQKNEKVRSNIEDAYETMKKYRRSPPGTQGHQLYKNAQANLEGYTSEYFAGKSESEFEKIKKTQPSMIDSDKTVDSKAAEFIRRMDSQHSYPLLDQFGISKPKLSLKRN